MKILAALLLSTVVAAGSLTACGQNPAQSSAAVEKTEDKTAEKAASNEAGSKIELTYWTTTNRKEWTESAIAAFTEEHPNVSITGTYDLVDALRKNLKVAASSDTLPSMWYNYGGNYFSYYADNGLSYDLTEYAKEHQWKDSMNNGALDLCTMKEKVCGYPQVLTTFGIVYRKDLFDKCGLKVPATFEEFENSMAVLKENGYIPLAIGGKNGWMLMRVTDLLIEKYVGEKERDSLYALEGDWSQDGVVKAFAKLKEWTDAGYLPDGFVTSEPNDARLLLYNGQAAMTIDGAPLSRMMKSNDCDFNQFGSFRIPFGETDMRMPTYITMIQYNSKLSQEQLEAAIAFTEFTLSDNAANENMQEYPLPYKDAGFPEEVPLIAPLQENFDKAGGFVTGDNALPQEVSSFFYQADEAVTGGTMTPEEAAGFMQEKISAYLKNQ